MLHRFLHQFLPLRYAQGCRHPQGQDRPSGRQPVHRAWIQAGAGHARGKRRPRRPDRRGCPHPRMRLRPLHRYGPVSQFRRHFPSDLQPQFRGPVGYGRRPGVSGQPRDGRGVRPGRGIHRSAYPRGDAEDRDAGILPHQRQLDRPSRPGRGHGRGGNPPWAQHQAFPGDSAPGGVHRG